jgi:hypothetical protein
MNLHPKGYHDAKIIDHGISTTKNEKLQVVVKFETEHGQITGFLYMSDRAAEYTIEKIKNMGFNGNSLDELNDGRCLVGNPCVIKVDHEDYQEKISAKVNGVYPPGYVGKEVERDADAAKSIKRFDAMLKKAAGAAPYRATSAAKGGGDDCDAEEIPF